MTERIDPPGDGGAGGGGAPDFADVVLLDGRLVPRDQAVVSAFDRAVMYGESLFETLKVVDGAPCLWTRHRDRLLAGCEELGIPLDITEVEGGVRALLAARPVGLGVLRLQVTGGEQPGGGRGITAPREGRRPRVIAGVSETTPLSAAAYQAGVRLVSSRGCPRPLPGLKSGNYLVSVAAKARAEAAAAFECLLVDEKSDVVLEGSFSNVLAWDGRGIACPGGEGRLPGVTLGVVVEEASALGIPVSVRPVPMGEALESGLLLTGSLLGVCAASSLDGAPLRDSADVAARLRERLLAREVMEAAGWRSGGR